jgi:hypothetical protein
MNNIQAEIASIILSIAIFCGMGLLILHIIEVSF